MCIATEPPNVHGRAAEIIKPSIYSRMQSDLTQTTVYGRTVVEAGNSPDTVAFRQ